MSILIVGREEAEPLGFPLFAIKSAFCGFMRNDISRIYVVTVV